MGQLLHILRDDVARQRGERLMPAGLDEQGRRAVRGFGHGADFADTIATGPGSADALGDDQAQRHSGWGALDESAAVEGGVHREPSRTFSEAPGLLASLLWPLAVVAAVAAVAIFLPHDWPMAWPLG